jgi:hypothetical protein
MNYTLRFFDPTARDRNCLRPGLGRNPIGEIC